MMYDAAINSVNLKAKSDFPYLVLNVINENSYPRNPGFQVMHWHEDLQFILVLSGNIEVKTLAETVCLQAGMGIFINKNIIHLVTKQGDCHYKSFIFPDFFLRFYPGNPAEDIVTAISNNPQLHICRLEPGISWQETILHFLQHLSRLEDEPTACYHYDVLTTLCCIWLSLAEHIGMPAEVTNSVVQERMRAFLGYIEHNYGQPISLTQLAECAHVSKSECLRCFKLSMQTTPYRYLLDFRLAKAAELLRNSTQPVQDIAELVGFSQSSHFGRAFKAKMGCSPKEYRHSKG